MPVSHTALPDWVKQINRLFPLRWLGWALCAVVFVVALAYVTHGGALVAWLLMLLGLAGVLLGLHDIRQPRHAVLRNYPVLGHLRFLLEFIRPELRQYFIESDSEAAPFSRAQRSLVYQRAKDEPDKRPFGTQRDVHREGYEWINHSLSPTHLATSDFRITVGGPQCTQPYSASVFNISAMSFGSLSANAILALNAGAKRGNFMHDTGEGSISPYHRRHDGDLVWEIASGYFGCRDAEGRFNEERFVTNARDPQVKLIEIKLSQGAKPGHGGMLPGPKVTAEIAATRGIPMGRDCISPSAHSAFSTPVELLQFVARLRELSGGKPTGFKLAIGHPWEWFAICKAMLETGILPDFVVVDGGEGGTGAAPLEFTDHIGTPLQEALLMVHNTLVGIGLRAQIRIGAAGKIISAFDIARALALGADWCNAARGFMFALGCIQSQNCHTGECPTGVATQDDQRQAALVPADKAERVYRFHRNTMEALRELVQAAGLDHPSDFSANHILRRVEGDKVRLLVNHLWFTRPGDVLAADRGEQPWPHDIYRLYWPMARADSFSPAKQDLDTSLAVQEAESQPPAGAH